MKAARVSLTPVSHYKTSSFERVYIGDPSMKSVHIQSISGPYLSTIKLNPDQKNSEYGHFLCSEYFGGKHTLQLKPGADYILFDK